MVEGEHRPLHTLALPLKLNSLELDCIGKGYTNVPIFQCTLDHAWHCAGRLRSAYAARIASAGEFFEEANPAELSIPCCVLNFTLTMYLYRIQVWLALESLSRVT
jgi:hypothetical protein